MIQYDRFGQQVQLSGGGGLGGLSGLSNYVNQNNQYDPNPPLTAAIVRLAKSIEAMKPRIRVKMGRSIV